MKKNDNLNLKGMLFLLIASLFVSCKKDFLSEQPDKSLFVPTSLSDFQSLLDNNSIMNKTTYLAFAGTDEVSVSDAGLQGAAVSVRNAYLWADDVYQGAVQLDWRGLYQQVFYTNIVMDGLKALPQQQDAVFKNVKGSALFYRSFAYFQLLQTYSLAYEQSTAESRLGIPILLVSDVNQKYQRSSLKKSYQQVIEDLETASGLLPENASNVYRPNQAAVYALLSRVYLSMGDFAKARSMADECLKRRSTLLDYNILSLNASAATIPFPATIPVNLNPEVLFSSSMISTTFINAATTVIAPELLQSFATNDLRRAAFAYFRSNGAVTFKGKYSGNTLPFAGLALDEVILTRAECRARLGDAEGALADLNQLMKKRYAVGTFQEYKLVDVQDLVGLILLERKKELLFRGTRWMDLKRLNVDPKYAVTLTRNVGGKTYTLSPNSNKYALPIPDEEIINSGIQQNER